LKDLERVEGEWEEEKEMNGWKGKGGGVAGKEWREGSGEGGTGKSLTLTVFYVT
jgi:hypothetical protein